MTADLSTIVNGVVVEQVNGNAEEVEARDKDADIVNGNRPSESIHSIDVLSAGGSEAGDTLSRNVVNNNNVLAWRDTLRNHRKTTHDQKYFVAKELLMTERTYKKDIEVITVWWSHEVMSRGAPASLGRACLSIEPLALAAGTHLAALERAMHRDSENNQGHERVIAVLEHHILTNFDAYQRYCLSAGLTVAALEAALRLASPPKTTPPPLSLALHLLRPLHRLLYYEDILCRLDASEESCLRAHDLAESARRQLSHAENHALLCQLRNLLIDYDLLVGDREFIRMGCAYKHSNTGLQQRMLFLFSDVLVVGARSDSAFRCAKSYNLNNICLHKKPQDGFSIQDEEGISVFTVENSSEAWIDDLTQAIQNTFEKTTNDTSRPEKKSILSEQTTVLWPCSGGAALAWVCWHRDTTLSKEQMHLAARTHLSGYLLRKFKNSQGWQKLWVSFAVFTLYFYKSWTDDNPLASLPLLGYKVTVAEQSDGITKDLVLKLLYKNHVYYFRAESQYTFERWMEALSTAAGP